MFKNKLLKTSLFGLMAAIFVLLGGLVGEARAVSVTTAPDVSISVDNVGGSFTAIGDIVITEDAAGEIAIGDHIFTLPSEWEFATTTETITALASGGELAVTSPITATNGQSFTVSVTAISTSATSTLTISGVEVRPATTTSSVSHEIFHDSGSVAITGITNNSTSFGTVTTIPGSVTQLAITTEPTTTVYGSTISTIDVVTHDQFGNLSTSGLAATEDVTATVSSGTGTLSGTTVINIGTDNGNGSISFTDLTLDAVDSYTLQVNSTSYAADTTTSFDITQKELTISGSFDVSDKTYDGITDATISTNGLSLEGTVGEDAVNLIDIVLDFDNENVGLGKTVSITSANINDTNYSLSLTSAPTTLANISQAPLTVTAPEITKVYDGTTDVPETSSSLSGLQDDDVAGNIATLTFDDKNVGANKSVTPSGLVIHNNTGDTTDITSNYNITYTPNTTSSITEKELTVTGATAADKVYDGDNIIDITGAELSGVVGEDNVYLTSSSTGTTIDENVGNGKSVSTSMGITGTDAGNYSLTQPTGLTADITQAPLTVTAPQVIKVYDGEITTTTIESTLGSLADDDVAGNIATLTFDNKNVGTGKTVTPSGLIIYNSDGNATDITTNYNITYTPNTTSSITQKELTVTGATAVDKVYDDTLAATTTGATLSGVVSGDDVYMTATTTGVFASSDVSNDIAVTSNTSLAGTDASNYTLTQQSGMTANITAKPLNITGAAATSKAYDGTTVATITGATLDGVVGEDDVYLTSSSTGTFATSSPGTDIEVTTAMVLAGDDADNYTITSPTLNADITHKTLDVTFAALDKVYDGTDDAILDTWTLDTASIIPGDEVSIDDYEAWFVQSVIGEDIEVSASFTKAGAQEAYYTLNPGTGIADITPKMLTVVGASVTTKNYDGNTDATITGATLDGVVSGDNVVLENHTTGTFASKYPGSNIPVATAMIISGDHAGNYTLQQPTLTGTIKSTGGGGGGSSITFCSAVSYGEWGECTGGFQYRDVLTKTPTACTLTTEQQLGGQRLCVVGDEDGEENEEQGSVEENNDDEEGSDDSSSDVDVVGVMNRERNKVLNVNRVLSNRMAGRILLQVEENGEAWYVDPKSTNKYFMGRPADAFQLMRNFGLGISEANYNNFSTNGVPAKYAGQILLRVERNGEAYYINPDTLEMHYLGRPADAFRIMRELALGISNDNLRQIQVGE